MASRSKMEREIRNLQAFFERAPDEPITDSGSPILGFSREIPRGVGRRMEAKGSQEKVLSSIRALIEEQARVRIVKENKPFLGKGISIILAPIDDKTRKWIESPCIYASWRLREDPTMLTGRFFFPDEEARAGWEAQMRSLGRI